LITGDYYQLPTGRVAALDTDTPFPPIACALKEPNGLIAIGGELSSQRLLDAYKHGIFPWFSEGEPILWWSPDPRMVLFPDDLKISKSLSKRLKKQGYQVKFNQHFRQVMEACASVNRDNQLGTWITAEMIDAYCELHAQGHAYCAETWMDNQLVGGLYGVVINRIFYGESMFHHITDASKIAFVHMVNYLKQSHIGMIDCQMNTAHLASLGAKEIGRDDFMSQLTALIALV
jgi:leucyl/phenylalanyl-tRNA--protein transferase